MKTSAPVLDVSLLAPEMDLLLWCARSTMKQNPGTCEANAPTIGPEFGWETFSRCAARHGLVPHVYRALSSLCREKVPARVLERLRAHFYVNAASSLRAARELRSLLQALHDAGVTAVPYKGPVLASYLFGSPEWRQFVDLDILVPRIHVDRARGVMEECGYLGDVSFSPVQERLYLKSRYHHTFFRTQGQKRLLVELHWEIISRNIFSLADLGQFMRRLQPLPFEGEMVHWHSPEDLLLILCLHGAKDLWARLGFVCDVARLVEMHPRMSWGLVYDRANEMGCRRVMLLGLVLAHCICGAATPGRFLRMAERETNVTWLARHTSEQLLHIDSHDPGVSHDALQTMLFYFRLSTRFPDKVRMWTAPNEQDAGAFHGSPGLLALMRPFRLLGKYGPGRLRRVRDKG